MTKEQREQSMDTGEDIIELVEVVKAGKSKVQAGDTKNEFTSDLNSMLDEIERKEQEAEAVDQPFPDPTPVAHHVDHNESLEMPSMSDLDNLLETLGAAEKSEEVVTTQDGLSGAGDSLDVASVDKGKITAALDKALEEKEAEVVETPSIITPKEVPVDVDDLPIDSMPERALQEANAKIEKDINELDALLDELSPKNTGPIQAPATSRAQTNITDIEAESLAMLEEFKAERAAMLEEFELERIAMREEAKQFGEPVSYEDLQEEMVDFKQQYESLHEQVEDFKQQQGSLQEQREDFKQQLAVVQEQYTDIINSNTAITVLASKIGTLEKRFTELEKQVTRLPDAHTNLEEMVARAAAKIIREEIANLLQSFPPK